MVMAVVVVIVVVVILVAVVAVGVGMSRLVAVVHQVLDKLLERFGDALLDAAADHQEVNAGGLVALGRFIAPEPVAEVIVVALDVGAAVDKRLVKLDQRRADGAMASSQGGACVICSAKESFGPLYDRV